MFSVVQKETGELIGDCGLEQMEDQGAAELGYDFQGLKLPRLISLIRVGNLPSKRVTEKAGMALAKEITRYGNQYW